MSTTRSNNNPINLKHIGTIRCPKFTLKSQLGFKLCRKLKPTVRRSIVLASLFAELKGTRHLSKADRLELKTSLRLTGSVEAMLLPILLSKRIWPHVLPVSDCVQSTERLAIRLLDRMPMWFYYGEFDQRLRDVTRVIELCRA